MKTIFQLAWKILTEKRQRTFLLGASVTLAAFLLFTSYFFLFSLTNSSNVISGRLGADLLLVPKGMGAYAGDTLVFGKTSKLYFNGQLLSDKLNRIDDIREWAPQLYLETVSTACCGTIGNYPVVAFDPERDFTLKAFMPEAQQLREDEIVIGAKAGGERFLYHYKNAPIKERVMLFAQPFIVRNLLFTTGTGADETIFIRLDAAHRLMEISEALQHMSATDLSAVFINTEPETQLLVKEQLEQQLPDVDVVIGNGLRSQIQKQVAPLKLLSYGMIGLALLFTILQAATLISAIIQERKKEIGLLLALGVHGRSIYWLFFTEVVIVAFISCCLGIFFSLGLLYDRQTLLYMIFQLPLAVPTLVEVLQMGIITAALVFLVVSLAAFLPLRGIVSKQPYDIVREGEC